MDKPHYRTVFIRDTHLGRRACQADQLLSFLKSITCDTLYLVGDILDLWQLNSGWYWPEEHNHVIRRILKMASLGTHVVYILGNHDDHLYGISGIKFGDISVQRQTVHKTLNGLRLLVTHGDEFDILIKRHRWLGVLGSHVLNWLLTITTGINQVCSYFGLDRWSLANYLKQKTNVTAIHNYEQIMTIDAKRRGHDGVVCGHTHDPKMIDVDGILYCNDGDWVYSCTALVEHQTGELELLRWKNEDSSHFGRMAASG